MTGYHDQEIVEFLRYGWPIETHQMKRQACQIPPNQKSACSADNFDKLNEYIDQELKRGSVISPFDANVLGKEACFSPLNAIPKKDLDDLRIIMNLSYPRDGMSINDAVSKDTYLGQDTNLVYPSMENLVQMIKKKGRGALLFKRDLWKYYRQIFLDPGAIHLVRFVFNSKIYYDVVLTMGL